VKRCCNGPLKTRIARRSPAAVSVFDIHGASFKRPCWAGSFANAVEPPVKVRWGRCRAPLARAVGRLS
jgi:hypothetical protein